MRPLTFSLFLSPHFMLRKPIYFHRLTVHHNTFCASVLLSVLTKDYHNGKKKKKNQQGVATTYKTSFIICVCSVAQSCPTLCGSIDCSLQGSSVHGIFQARTLE